MNIDCHKEQIQRITLIGLVGNVILSAAKLAIGLLGNSQAVVADALHSFSDTTSDLLILFGVRYWTAPPDDTHPYGHHKVESITTICIGIILIVVAAGIGYSGMINLLNPRPVEINWIVIAGPAVSIAVKEFLFRITYRVGLKINSTSLKANAWHHRTDALSSIPVLVAVLACLVDSRLWFLDQIGAIVVCVFIIKVGLEIMFNSLNELIDTGISKEKIREIKKKILSAEQVRGVHKLRTRKLANYIYIDLHLEVDGQMSVADGHDISENVKQMLLAEYPKIIDVMVHLEPEQSG